MQLNPAYPDEQSNENKKKKMKNLDIKIILSIPISHFLKKHFIETFPLRTFVPHTLSLSTRPTYLQLRM